jgi:hypothetical protein
VTERTCVSPLTTERKQKWAIVDSLMNACDNVTLIVMHNAGLDMVLFIGDCRRVYLLVLHAYIQN